MAITAPTYDPIPTSTALAEAYVGARQKILTQQIAAATAAEQGLGELNSAMTSFQNSLSSLTGLNKTVFAQAATFGDPTIGTAVAASTAASGSYSFFVKQLATASQVAYKALGDTAAVSGKLTIEMGGVAAFDVNLGATERSLTPRELAAAINGASGNDGKVTASIITTGGTSELVLTAKDTGTASKIRVNTSGLGGADGAALATKFLEANASDLVQAQNAEIHVGAENGTVINQASNTFTAVDGVKMTFTKAQASGAAPVKLTVGADNKATTDNAQAFVEAFNKLKAVLSKLTSSGDPSKGVAGGAFANDSGIRSLNERLGTLLRPAGGDSLASFGIIATRSGTLELNSTRLLSQLARNPTGLDTLIGSSASSAPTGIAGALDKYLKSWSNGVDGQIKQRQEQTSTLQTQMASRQVNIDQQYDAAYSRYLRQFTQLQSMQGVMNQNVSLFDALFSNDKN